MVYIRQLIIQGFKSYKEQTEIEPFSPKHNVIVGRNGSGKSNFFAAIRFVLSDAYTQMGREERQALLHEGSGSAVMSAYVEIIFDNSDERFPTGKPELVLRRTIGTKKDEYTLDRKSATKADVMNLLESAGFSRSNPYYIVPQGRVTALTNMRDAERLTLLKDVAGTQVYEARRTESLKIMEDTHNKRSKIDDLLEYIKERLAELEEEKEELKEYQEKDREKRCLEYTIYHREQQAIQAALEEIDEKRQTGVDETDENREMFIEGEKELAKIDSQIAELKQQMEFLRMDKAQLEGERKEAVRDKAKTELDVNNLTEGQAAAQSAKTRNDQELKDIQAQINQREAELATLLPQYHKRRDDEATMKAQLADAEGTRQRLYAKQGRSSQFQNKRQRDDFLQKEIDDINMALATRKAVAMQTADDITDLEEEIGRLDVEISDLRTKLDGRGDDMQTIAQEVEQVKEQKENLTDQRKELWRENDKLDSIIGNAQNELDRAETSLSHMMDYNTRRGLASVRRIKQQYNLPGLYGTLAELFEVSDSYKTAVEVTAGTSLFHYVCDTDDTASKAMEVLQRERAGRVTFMPLSRLKNRPVNVPKASDAVHMISKLNYDERYEAAFQNVFGKTIICPNLQVAAQYARSHAVSAITPEGDRADKKGALTGGFHDPRNSRIDAVRNVAKWRAEFDSHKNRSTQIKNAIAKFDQQITKAVSDETVIEQRRQRLEDSYSPMRQELRSKQVDLQRRQDELARKQQSRDNLEQNVRELGEQQASYQTEIDTDFKKALSKEEEQLLQRLDSSVQDLRKQYAEVSASRSELEARKTTIEVELRENLRLRLDQLTTQEVDSSSGLQGTSSAGRLKDRQRELKRLEQSVAALEEKLSQADEAIEQAQDQLNKQQQTRNDKQAQQEDIARAIERHQKRIEKSMAAKAGWIERAAECARNIRDLGVLPEEAFEKYQRLESDKAMKRLHKVKETLKKYAHVNKKAFEQYNNFTKQRDTLTKRRQELEKSQDSIEELIEVLDQRKDEAIERTFKQVSREFANVFGKLVPAGKGRLIIQRKSDREAKQDDEESEDEEERRQGAVENYTGVGISVSFNSKHDEQQRIQQLSGGQKSLCALALVFAIQQCDPAPFYLFDEIDANLDAQYRTAVAAMLQQLSETGQFICTTFRPEMVLVAEKCYGVSYSNKTSSIDVVGRDDALEFVEGQKQ
ncbi:putative chromosome segregation protein SudA [Rhizodiscina lignyota]|uniref:Structural maintenance of chromosomes protein n=1 Tax=Rhizodiscina lignyota TaxID=1504668 RepID=A0A9P4IUK6_9PEZI|nr:putative chromosome segregation protein SudA [Rhizodiscina lignyota]